MSEACASAGEEDENSDVDEQVLARVSHNGSDEDDDADAMRATPVGGGSGSGGDESDTDAMQARAVGDLGGSGDDDDDDDDDNDAGTIRATPVGGGSGGDDDDAAMRPVGGGRGSGDDEDDDADARRPVDGGSGSSDDDDDAAGAIRVTAIGSRNGSGAGAGGDDHVDGGGDQASVAASFRIQSRRLSTRHAADDPGWRVRLEAARTRLAQPASLVSVAVATRAMARGGAPASLGAHRRRRLLWMPPSAVQILAFGATALDLAREQRNIDLALVDITERLEVTCDERVVHGHGTVARVDLARGETLWDPTAVYEPTDKKDVDNEHVLRLGGNAGRYILRDDHHDGFGRGPSDTTADAASRAGNDDPVGPGRTALAFWLNEPPVHRCDVFEAEQRVAAALRSEAVTCGDAVKARVYRRRKEARAADAREAARQVDSLRLRTTANIAWRSEPVTTALTSHHRLGLRITRDVAAGEELFVVYDPRAVAEINRAGAAELEALRVAYRKAGVTQGKRIQVGTTRIRKLFTKYGWYNATVVADHGDGTYTVRYDEADLEESIPSDVLLKLILDPPAVVPAPPVVPPPTAVARRERVKSVPSKTTVAAPPKAPPAAAPQPPLVGTVAVRRRPGRIRERKTEGPTEGRVDAVALELFRRERREEALASVLVAAGVNNIPARGWHNEIVARRSCNNHWGFDVYYWTPNGRGGEKPPDGGVLRSIIDVSRWLEAYPDWVPLNHINDGDDETIGVTPAIATAEYDSNSNNKPGELRIVLHEGVLKCCSE